MNKIIVHNLISLDGYYAGPDEQVDAIWKYHHIDYADDMSFHYFNMDLMKNSSVLCLGKKTFLDKFNVNWKQMENNPKAEYLEREMANVIGSINKIVVSNSLVAESFLSNDNTKIIKREDVYTALADLKQNSDKDITIIGSRTLWQDLLNHDLIDEIRLTIAPVFSGSGTPLFAHQPEIYLKRTDTRIAEGNIMVVFTVSRKKP